MDIAGGGVKALAEQTGASWWRHWKTAGITRRPVRPRFGRAFHHAVKRADEIHFSLDGIDDVGAAIKQGARGFIHNNMTNAELYNIVKNAKALQKTTFYRRGEVVSHGQLP